jgi:FtsH-binding integral membrane protein
MRSDEAARFVGRAVFSYVTVPLPSQIDSTAALAFLPEQIVWYVLVALAPIGLVFAMRRDPLVASMLLTHAVIAALLIAFTSGNIGTLVRHRGFALPYLIWISAVGACELLARGVATGRVHQT